MARLDWYIRANLKIRHFQMLVALDDWRSIPRAAAVLGIPEQHLKKSLTSLASGLENPLFEETLRGLEPTEYGACLIEHGRRVINRLINAQEEMRDMQEGRVARVTIGVLPATTAALVPTFIAALESETVPVAISIREATLDNLLKDLRSGSIDLAISILPPQPMGSDLIQEVLFQDRIVPAVRRDHPLTRASKLKWNAIEVFPTVMPPTGTWLRMEIDTFLARQSIQMSRLNVDSTSTLTNVGVLQFTDSVGFLSSEVARYFEDLGLISVLPLQMPGCVVNVGTIWMKDRHMALELKLVHMVLKDRVPKTPAGPTEEMPYIHSVSFEQMPVHHQGFW